MFKKGDKVWSIQLGECEVVFISPREPYPVTVKNKSGTKARYMAKGFYQAVDASPSLFHKKPYDELPPEPNRLPDLKMDARILVRNSEKDTWVRRHFKKWIGDKPVCWGTGTTSRFRGSSIEWEFWKLPEDDDV